MRPEVRWLRGGREHQRRRMLRNTFRFIWSTGTGAKTVLLAAGMRRHTGEDLKMRNHLGITVHADFSFYRKDEREEGLCLVLVMFDDDKGAFGAMGMRSKAINKPIVKWVVDKLSDSGYNGQSIAFKADQEMPS